METAQITFSFDRYADAKLDVFARKVVASLTANEYFPDPQPGIALASGQQQAFAQALDAAQGGGRLQVAKKNDARALLIDMLKQLGQYVQYMGKGQKSILLTSGFDLAKERSSFIELEQPSDIRLEGSARGEISIQLNPGKGTHSFIFQIAPDPLTPASHWESAASTRSRHTFTGLASGQRYWLRAVAVGTNEQSVTSEAHTWVAQ